MKNKEITIYELMGLIKDNKTPKKIKYDDVIFIYNKRYKCYFDFEGISLFSKDYVIDVIEHLDNQVEILPEENDEWEDIEELNYTLPSTHEKGKLINKDGNYNTLRKIDITILEKVNQLIKNQKYLKERIDKND